MGQSNIGIKGSHAHTKKQASGQKEKPELQKGRKSDYLSDRVGKGGERGQRVRASHSARGEGVERVLSCPCIVRTIYWTIECDSSRETIVLFQGTSTKQAYAMTAATTAPTKPRAPIATVLAPAPLDAPVADAELVEAAEVALPLDALPILISMTLCHKIRNHLRGVRGGGGRRSRGTGSSGAGGSGRG